MKNIESMTRPELVEELRKYLPTLAFHHVISEHTPTHRLRSYLLDYRQGETPVLFTLFSCRFDLKAPMIFKPGAIYRV